MTRAEFDILSFDGKASLLSKYGRFIDERSTVDGSRVMVYDLFGFYVEVGYRNDKRVQYIRTCAQASRLTTQNDLPMLYLN